MNLVAILFFLKFVFILNLPFGYWRSGVKKFSWQWFVAIHLPVIVLFLTRRNIGIEYNWYILPLTLLTFFLGQKAGQKIRDLYISYRKSPK